VDRFVDPGLTERFDESSKELDDEYYSSGSDDSETWRDRWDQMYDIYKRHVANHEEMIDGCDSGVGSFHLAYMEVSCLLKRILGGLKMLA
jgi:hypothetical protein